MRHEGRRCDACRRQAQTSCPYGMAGVGRTYAHPEIAETCSSFSAQRFCMGVGGVGNP